MGYYFIIEACHLKGNIAAEGFAKVCTKFVFRKKLLNLKTLLMNDLRRTIMKLDLPFM